MAALRETEAGRHFGTSVAEPPCPAPPYGKRAPIPHVVEGHVLETPKGEAFTILVPCRAKEKAHQFPNLRLAERCRERTLRYVSRNKVRHVPLPTRVR